MKPEVKTIRLSDVTFDEVIYPRRSHDPALVQRYVEVIDEIEAAQRFIAVSADLKLLDGKQRQVLRRSRRPGQHATRAVHGCTGECREFGLRRSRHVVLSPS